MRESSFVFVMFSLENSKQSQAMSSTSDSVTAAQATSIQQFHLQQGFNDNDDHMQTFVALQLEKRRLLDQQLNSKIRNGTTTTTFHAIKEQQQHQQQQEMNDLNRRLYAVVQRMSAYERYKRKKKTFRANHTWIAHKCNRLLRMQAQVDECRQRLVNFDGWKRLADEMQKDVHLYQEMANLLRGQPADTNNNEEEKQQQEQSDQPQPEPSERDQRRNSLKELIKGIVERRQESRSQDERSRAKAEEDASLFQARLEEQRAQADERARLRQARLDEQQAEQDRILRAKLEEQRAQADERARLRQACFEKQEAEHARIHRAQLEEQRAQADERARLRQACFDEQEAEQERIYREQRAHADEKYRITLAQIDQRLVEQTEMEKVRLAQIKEQRALEDKRRRESMERSQEQAMRIFRRIDKRKENYAWDEEWRSKRQLVVQRRAKQSANAG